MLSVGEPTVKDDYFTPSFAPNRSCLVVYDEFGYKILGDCPTTEELSNIQEESQKHIEKREVRKSILRKLEMEYLQALYETDHPIETLWNKFICWIKA